MYNIPCARLSSQPEKNHLPPLSNPCFFRLHDRYHDAAKCYNLELYPTEDFVLFFSSIHLCIYASEDIIEF